MIWNAGWEPQIPVDLNRFTYQNCRDELYYGGFLKCGTPKSSHLIFGVSVLNQHFWGFRVDGNPHLQKLRSSNCGSTPGTFRKKLGPKWAKVGKQQMRIPTTDTTYTGTLCTANAKYNCNVNNKNNKSNNRYNSKYVHSI